MEPGPAQVRIGDALAIGVAPRDTDSDTDPEFRGTQFANRCSNSISGSESVSESVSRERVSALKLPVRPEVVQPTVVGHVPSRGVHAPENESTGFIGCRDLGER